MALSDSRIIIFKTSIYQRFYGHIPFCRQIQEISFPLRADYAHPGLSVKQSCRQQQSNCWQSKRQAAPKQFRFPSAVWMVRIISPLRSFDIPRIPNFRPFSRISVTFIAALLTH